MTTKRIIFTQPNGQLGFLIPAPAYVATFPTEAEALAAIQAKDLPPGATNVAICEVTDLPTSRRFRNAWRRSGPGGVVDLPLARTQRMNEVRTERTPKLTKSDVDYLKAQEAADLPLQANLETYRQALRDLPQAQQAALDACATPEALAAWTPTWPVDPA